MLVKKPSVEKRDRAIALYKQGWTIRDIAFELETTQEWVREYIKHLYSI